MNLILYLPYVKYLILIILLFICLFYFLKYLLSIPGNRKLGRIFSEQEQTHKKYKKRILILLGVIIIYTIILYLFEIL